MSPTTVRAHLAGLALTLIGAQAQAGTPHPEVAAHAQAAIKALEAYEAPAGRKLVERSARRAHDIARKHATARQNLAAATDRLTRRPGMGEILVARLIREPAPEQMTCNPTDLEQFWMEILFSKEGLAGLDPTWRYARKRHRKEEWRDPEAQRNVVRNAIEAQAVDGLHAKAIEHVQGPLDPPRAPSWGRWNLGELERRDAPVPSPTGKTVIEEAQATAGDDNLVGPMDNVPRGRKDAAERAGEGVWARCAGAIVHASGNPGEFESIYCKWHGDRSQDERLRCRTPMSQFGPVHWLDAFKEERLAACYTSEYCVTDTNDQHAAALETVAPNVAQACKSEDLYEGVALVRRDARHQAWLAPRCPEPYRVLGEKRIKGRGGIWQSEIGSAMRRSKQLDADLAHVDALNATLDAALRTLAESDQAADQCLAEVLSNCASTHAYDQRPYVPLDPWRMDTSQPDTPQCIENALTSTQCANMIR